MQTRLKQLFELAEVFDEADCRGFHALVGAATEAADGSKAGDVGFVSTVTLCHSDIIKLWIRKRMGNEI